MDDVISRPFRVGGAASVTPIAPLLEPLSMKMAAQAKAFAEMAIGGMPFSDSDLALLSLRMAAWAEEVEALEHRARGGR